MPKVPTSQFIIIAVLLEQKLIQEEFTDEISNEVYDVVLTEEDYLKEKNKLFKHMIKDKDTIINDKENI